MKYTPGPWLKEECTVYAVTQRGWWKGKADMVNRFSFHVQRGHGCSEEEADAVTCLAAAAPDLYAVAKEMQAALDHISHQDIPEEQRDRIYAAIAKAEGGDQ